MWKWKWGTRFNKHDTHSQIVNKLVVNRECMGVWWGTVDVGKQSDVFVHTSSSTFWGFVVNLLFGDHKHKKRDGHELKARAGQRQGSTNTHAHTHRPFESSPFTTLYHFFRSSSLLFPRLFSSQMSDVYLECFSLRLLHSLKALLVGQSPPFECYFRGLICLWCRHTRPTSFSSFVATGGEMAAAVNSRRSTFNSRVVCANKQKRDERKIVRTRSRRHWDWRREEDAAFVGQL